jgi:fatty-acyl-CoA synthase
MLLLQPGGNQGIGSWPARRARMSPTAIALRQGATALTYAQLSDRVARLASGLRGAGVRAGDRVAWLGSNDVVTFEVFFACGLLGAVFVPLNTRLAPAELGYMLTDSGARILLVGRDVDSVVAGVMQEPTPVTTVVSLAPVPGLAALDLQSLISDSVEPVEPVDVVLDEPALLLYTSGTTGRPKAAILTHANLTWNTINQLAHIDIAGTDRALCISPLFHAVGLGMVTLPTLFKGGSVEVLARFDAGTVLDVIGRHQITSFSCVPTMLQLMTEHPAWDQADLSPLRHVIYGGSAISERVARIWLDRGVQVRQGYGMTEASPGIYMAMHQGAEEHPVSVGVPHFFTDVALLQGDGSLAPVQPGVEAGELVVRGPNVFAGYWQRPEETEQTLVDGGRWFRTGDVVRAGDDGWVYVVDRVKDMIISGGENIYPAEVEAVLTALDGVRSAAVVARPDERWGEVGVAFVELAAGAVVTEADLRKHLETHLARYKIPKYLHFAEELPRNATGKIRRVELRQLARSEDWGQDGGDREDGGDRQDGGDQREIR